MKAVAHALIGAKGKKSESALLLTNSVLEKINHGKYIGLFDKMRGKGFFWVAGLQK